MKKALLFAMLFFLVFAKTAQADPLSFGCVGIEPQRVTMIPGEIREFKLSFFNYGNDPLVVEMGKTGSDEILSIINPKYFVLEDTQSVINPMGEEEWVVLGDNYVKAVPVRIILKIPDNITDLTRNYHVVKILASATSEGYVPGGTSQKPSTACEVAYAITIPGNINAGNMLEYNQTLEEFYQEIQSNQSEDTGGFSNIGVKDSGEDLQEGSGERQLPTGFFSLGGDEEDSSFFYLVLIIAIILIYLVYRRLRR